MHHAELELHLYAPAPSQVVADMRLRPPDGASEADLALGAPISIDQEALWALALDPTAYGRALTTQLFATPQLREAWATMRGYIQGANTPLRLRLRIAPSAEHLHLMRWELLHDPFTQQFLCQSERILFSRYLDSDDLGRLRLPAATEVRALMAVSNPLDLEDFNLAVVDTAGEIARTRRALDDLPTTILDDAPDTSATLSRILDGLRAGHSLLYLVCHGTLLRGKPILWLMRDDGSADRVAGEVLVQRISDLPADRRPRLIVLASCQSAGRDDAATVLASLAPQLARAGVGAVIGMQGNVPMALVERLMPRFLSLLRRDGHIDHALALARADLPPDMDWWMPVLFMRVRDGRLWEAESSDAPAGNPVPQVAEGIDALVELLRVREVRATVLAFRSDFAAARAQVADLIALKDVHDLLHTLQFQCYLPLTREARNFPDDEIALESIRDYSLTLRTRSSEIRQVFAQAPDLFGASEWVNGLDAGHALLEDAVSQLNPAALKKALWENNRVLAVQPSYINANLITVARALRLRNLAEAMEALDARLSTVSGDRDRLTRFQVGVAALLHLRERLGALIAEHDAWQAIDREVRRVAESLRFDTSELEFSWPDLHARLLLLAQGNATWATALQSEMEQLDLAVVGSGTQRPAAVFQRCNRLIGERFFQVDVDLKRLCGQLRELSDPLAELEHLLA